MRLIFKPEAWKAACTRMNTTISEKNGKKPCGNYFITQGFCPWPANCPYHHEGVAGACSPPDTKRQADRCKRSMQRPWPASSLPVPKKPRVAPPTISDAVVQHAGREKWCRLS